MNDIKALIQHIAPTLAAALGGPFSRVATKYITDNLIDDITSDEGNPEDLINDLLNDSNNLKKIKELDHQFKLEMKKLNVDVFSLEAESHNDIRYQQKISHNPQLIISTLFLVAYFLILAAIFGVEASDSVNMQKGENSLMGELQILFGALTAGVGQILSFWFGGALKKKDAITD